jgi:hypothetical protein
VRQVSPLCDTQWLQILDQPVFTVSENCTVSSV